MPSSLYKGALAGALTGVLASPLFAALPPREAVRKLRSGDSAARMEAKRQLKSFRFKEIARAMREFANDPDPNIRMLMAQTLGELGGFEAARNLERLFKKEKEAKVRRSIFIQLAGLLPEDEEALAFFRKAALGDPDPEIRYLALAQSSLLGGSAKVRRQIADLAGKVRKKESAERNRALAAVILSEQGEGSEDLWADLSRALADPSPETRRRAALLSGPYLKGEEAEKRLAGALSDADAEVRANVARALGESQNPSAVLVLKKLCSDREPSVRRSALESLALFPAAQTGAALFIEALSDADAGIRAFAVGRLERLGDPAALAPLEKLLKKENDPQVNILAKKALAVLSGKGR